MCYTIGREYGMGGMNGVTTLAATPTVSGTPAPPLQSLVRCSVGVALVEPYTDPRDQFVRREHPINMQALAACWHVVGERDGFSRGALERRRQRERWDELRDEHWSTQPAAQGGPSPRPSPEGRGGPEETATPAPTWPREVEDSPLPAAVPEGPTPAHTVWAERVTARLPDVLDTLVVQAVDGKLPAIQLILKCEGLMEPAGDEEQDDDQYPVIIGVCCEPTASE